jgi:hypothetical protein
VSFDGEGEADRLTRRAARWIGHVEIDYQDAAFVA